MHTGLGRRSCSRAKKRKHCFHMAGYITSRSITAIILQISLTVCLSELRFIHTESLPPYSPDLNPIEEAFYQVKAFIDDTNVDWQNWRWQVLL